VEVARSTELEKSCLLPYAVRFFFSQSQRSLSLDISGRVRISWQHALYLEKNHAVVICSRRTWRRKSSRRDFCRRRRPARMESTSSRSSSRSYLCRPPLGFFLDAAAPGSFKCTRRSLFPSAGGHGSRLAGLNPCPSSWSRPPSSLLGAPSSPVRAQLEACPRRPAFPKSGHRLTGRASEIPAEQLTSAPSSDPLRARSGPLLQLTLSLFAARSVSSSRIAGLLSIKFAQPRPRQTAKLPRRGLWHRLPPILPLSSRPHLVLFVSLLVISLRFKSVLLAPHALTPHPSGSGGFAFCVESSNPSSSAQPHFVSSLQT
jgi:hypothetical protein